MIRLCCGSQQPQHTPRIRRQATHSDEVRGLTKLRNGIENTNLRKLRTAGNTQAQINSASISLANRTCRYSHAPEQSTNGLNRVSPTLYGDVQHVAKCAIQFPRRLAPVRLVYTIRGDLHTSPKLTQNKLTQLLTAVSVMATQ